jgi:hypothetical protein
MSELFWTSAAEKPKELRKSWRCHLRQLGGDLWIPITPPPLGKKTVKNI